MLPHIILYYEYDCCNFEEIKNATEAECVHAIKHRVEGKRGFPLLGPLSPFTKGKGIHGHSAAGDGRGGLAGRKSDRVSFQRERGSLTAFTGRDTECLRSLKIIPRQVINFRHEQKEERLLRVQLQLQNQ